MKRLVLIISAIGLALLVVAYSRVPATKDAPTPEPPVEPVLIAAQITDAHLRPEFNAPQRLRAALRHLRSQNPKLGLVFNTGDVIDGAKNRDDMTRKLEFWQSAVDAELAGTPMRSLLGNHDKLDGAPADDPQYGKAALCKILGMPSNYYSFDQAGWHFIMLDGTAYGGDPAQQQWLDNELKSVPATTPIAVLSHQPIFSMGATIHSPRDHIAGWKDLIAKFATYPNVKLCLSGHTHLYDQCRYNGVLYVCGGSLAGFWWEYQRSADGKGAYHQTKPGYGIIKLFANGNAQYDYINYAK